MKTQRITKSGAAIGSAVALLLISVLLAPSPALAGKDNASVKLVPTDVEPGASGHAMAKGGFFTEWFPPSWNGTVAGSCRGLTPAKTYTIVIKDLYYNLAGTVGAVASETGTFKVTCGFDSGYSNWFDILVVDDAGQVVLGGRFAIETL